MASSSLYRRLRDVFIKNTTKPKIVTATANADSKVPTTTPIFTAIADTNIEVSTTPISPTATSKQQRQQSSKKQKSRHQIRKFKDSTKDPRFRKLFTNYESFVRRLIRAKQFEGIADVIEYQKKYPEMKNERFVVRFITLYGKAGMFEHAQKLFDEMPELECERTVMSFNALLGACVNSKKYDKFSEIFRELPGKLGIEPDVVSFNTVIKAFCEMDSLQSAVAVMEEMGKNGIDPDVVTFNTMLVAFYKNKRFTDAENIWSLMEEKNVTPNVRSYNARLRCLLENDKATEAEELFEEMKEREVEPDTHSYNAMIGVYAKDGNLELAKSWYLKFGENGRVPDLVTFHLLVPLACDKGDPEFAFELCNECIALKHNMFTQTIQQVVDMLVAQSMIKEAKELVELGQNCSYRYRLSMPSDPQ